jgi:hypothetical protein
MGMAYFALRLYMIHVAHVICSYIYIYILIKMVNLFFPIQMEYLDTEDR